VGQPTWIGKKQIIIKTVMRSDIHISDHITLPPNTLVTMSSEAAGLAGQQSGKLTFQGSFMVNKVLHIGDSRNPDGGAWVTNFYCNTIDSTQDQTPPAENTYKSNFAQTGEGSGTGSST
jgi:hypothetical protein